MEISAETDRVQTRPDDVPAYHLADSRIEINPIEGTVIADNRPIDIKDKEFNVLDTLARRADRTIPLGELSTSVYGYDDESARRTIQHYTSVISKKLGSELGGKEGAVRNRYGLGYCAVSSLTGDTYVPFEGDSSAYNLADDRLVIYPSELTVICDDKILHDITKREFILLQTLAKRPDRTLGYHVLKGELRKLGGYEMSGPIETGAVHRKIAFLREKLGPKLGDSKEGAIRTIREVGYRAVSSLSEETT